MKELSRDQMIELYACPECRGTLDAGDQRLVCNPCRQDYPFEDGMIRFARAGADCGGSRTPDSLHYENKYGDDTRAVVYARSFDQVRAKQRRTARELRIISNLLARFDDNLTLVNVPCGGGRLSEPVSARCRLLIEADISAAQAAHAKRTAIYTPSSIVSFAVASATRLPVADGGIDGAVCVRLSHHLPCPDERGHLIGELARVSRHFVIVSFTDRRSLLSLSRSIRGKSLNPCSMGVDELKDHAHRHGFRLDAIETVSHTGSRHRFALLRRD